MGQTLHSRHVIARTRRAMNRAIENASTPALRDELIVISQRAKMDH